jgi:Holliday junction resolvase RusA-like endonuclease
VTVLECHFIIPGRPRAWKRAGSKGSQRFTPTAQKHAQSDIGWLARAAGIRRTAEAVSVEIEAVFPPPSKLRKAERAALIGLPALSVPDADNCAKLVLDAFNGIAYDDDAQVAKLSVVKVYGLVPQTSVSIRVLAGGFL